MATIERSIAYKVEVSSIINSNYIKQEGFNPNYIEFNGKHVSRVNLIATIVAKFMSDDGNYGAITIDDGTETIRIKAFGPEVIKIKDIEIGQLIRVVAKVKDYKDERFLAADFVKPIDDPNWLLVHQLEIEKIDPNAVASISQETTTMPTPQNKPTIQISEEKVGQTPTQTNDSTNDKSEHRTEQSSARPSESSNSLGSSAVSSDKSEDIPNFIEIISKVDSGDGAEIDKVITESKLSEEEAKGFIVNLLKDGEIYEPKKGILKVL
jgi:RPA family protein